MGFGEAIRTCFGKKYGDFQGRASRSEYWFWTLFTTLLFGGGYIAMTVAQALMGQIAANIVYGVAAVLALFLLFVPSVAVAIRRLHDTNSSGWWFLVFLLPYLGSFIMVVWFCFKGTAGDNRYGPDPLQGDVAEAFS